jgi:hypothetical protein
MRPVSSSRKSAVTHLTLPSENKVTTPCQQLYIKHLTFRNGCDRQALARSLPMMRSRERDDLAAHALRRARSQGRRRAGSGRPMLVCRVGQCGDDQVSQLALRVGEGQSGPAG